MIHSRRHNLEVLFSVSVAVYAAVLGVAFAAEPLPSPEWTPPVGFSSVAVAKIDGSGDLQLLIPVREFDLVTTTETYTVNVPYLKTVDGVVEQFIGQEARTRETQVQVCKNSFKMVRTSIPSESIALTNIAGTPVPHDQLKRTLAQTSYVVLGTAKPVPFVSNMLRKDALFLSIEQVDPKYAELPAVQGLADKWKRSEGLVTAAVAQIQPQSDRIAVTVTKQKMEPEVRTRMVNQPDGSAVEQSYTVTVPVAESVQDSLDLSECEITTVGGDPVSVAQARGRLAEPCRIFFDCTIGGYLGSVLESDTLVIRKKVAASIAE